MPCLHIDESHAIPESLIVSDYLDAKYDEHKLIPADPYTHAMHKLTVEQFSSKVIGPFYKFLRNTEPGADATFLDALDASLEQKLADQSFFGGSSPAMVDYMIWVRLVILSIFILYCLF